MRIIWSSHGTTPGRPPTGRLWEVEVSSSPPRGGRPRRMWASLWFKPLLCGLLLAGLTHLPGSGAWRVDPNGLAAAGLIESDGIPTWSGPLAPDPELALAVAGQAAARPSVVLDHLARAALMHPDDPRTRLALGTQLLRAQDYEGALRQLQRAQLDEPHDPLVLYELARAHDGLAHHDAAMACARALVAARPHWPAGHLRHGLLLIRGGRPDEGFAALRRAATCPAVAPGIHYELGNFFIERGAHQDAIPFFEAVLRWQPEHSYAANNLGNAYKSTGRAERARHYYLMAIAINPSNPNPHNGLGVVLEEKGDLKGALSAYHTAAELNPHYMDAHYNAGVLLLHLGHTEKAFQELQFASHLAPEFAMAHFQLAEAYFRLGRLRLAIASYLRATTLDPGVSQLPGQVPRLMQQGPAVGDLRPRAATTRETIIHGD